MRIDVTYEGENDTYIKIEPTSSNDGFEITTDTTLEPWKLGYTLEHIGRAIVNNSQKEL